MGGFCTLLDFHQEGSAPAAWTAGLFKNYTFCTIKACLHWSALHIKVKVFPDQTKSTNNLMYLHQNEILFGQKKQKLCSHIFIKCDPHTIPLY